MFCSRHLIQSPPAPSRASPKDGRNAKVRQSSKQADERPCEVKALAQQNPALAESSNPSSAASAPHHEILWQ